MYIPEHFAETDPEALAAVIRDYNFGTLITSGAQGLFATHMPFVAGNERPPRRLRAHMAKANPHWKDIGEGIEALAIFQGPHAYISPSWYVSRPRVPTWNYISVHVYGQLRLLSDLKDVLDTLARTVSHQEDGRAEPWRMASLPESYLAGMAKNVVALELLCNASKASSSWARTCPRRTGGAPSPASSRRGRQRPKTRPTPWPARWMKTKPAP